MSNYRQYTDTFSILNYLQNHRLWRGEKKKKKKRSKFGLLLSRKFQITYKIIVCGEITVKIGTILSRTSSKDPSWLAMCNVYFRNELPTRLPARLMPFSIRVTSCRYELAVIFTCRLCIDITMSNWTCCIVPWIFQQSILYKIDNSTNFDNLKGK